MPRQLKLNVTYTTLHAVNIGLVSTTYISLGYEFNNVNFCNMLRYHKNSDFVLLILNLHKNRLGPFYNLGSCNSEGFE